MWQWQKIQKMLRCKGIVFMKVKGFKFAGISCGIKKNGGKDLALAVFEKPCLAEGVYTKNIVRAPSVELTKKRILKGEMKALLVISGNASVCVNGAAEDAIVVTQALAKKLSIEDDTIAHATTGVIGVKLPTQKVLQGIESLTDSLSYDYKDFSEAIRTTDAFEKVAFKSFDIDGKKVNILGVGKGAGMIAPNMATMLMFIFTDANIEKSALKKAFKKAVDKSFNSISVDGDTSTNDMVLIFASKLANNREITIGSEEYKSFSENLSAVCLELAKLVVKDGEGATKLIEIVVKGAKTEKEAKTVARTVANSQLVKTAFFGGDPNWGRIMAAIGRSYVHINPSNIEISIQGYPVVQKGVESPIFKEERLAELLKAKEILVEIDLNVGKAKTCFYTSDLTFDYVKLNSAYRT